MKFLKRILGTVFILSLLLFTLSVSFTASANTLVNTDIFAPFTYVEYLKLDSPVDVYVDDEMTVILEHNDETNFQQITVFKNNEYTFYSNKAGNGKYIDFDNIHHVERFNNYLVLQDRYRPFILNLTTGSYTEVKSEGVAIPCSYFGFNNEFFVSLYNNQINIYKIQESDSLTLTYHSSITSVGNGDIDVHDDYLYYFDNQNNICKKNLKQSDTALTYTVGANGNYLISNGEIILFSNDSGVMMVNIETGVVSKVKSTIGVFEKLGDVASPNGIAFKKDFVLIADESSNTIQGFSLEDFSFNGYAIATTEPCDTRGSANLIDVVSFEEKVYLLDTNKILIINGQTINSVPYYLDFTPTSISTDGEVALLVGNSKLAFVDLKDGTVLYTFVQAHMCKSVCVDGEFFVLTAEISNTYNGRLIKINKDGDKTFYSLNINNVSALDLISADVDGMLYVFAQNTKTVYLLDKEGKPVVDEYLVEKKYTASNTAIKMGVDLNGNVYLLGKDNLIEKIYANGAIPKTFNLSVSNKLPNANAKSMSITFDKKEVFFIFENQGYVLSTNGLENDNVIKIVESVKEGTNFITTDKSISLNKLNFATIKENKNVYFFNKVDGKNTYFATEKNNVDRYSIAGETNNFYILVGTNTALVKKQDLSFLDKSSYLEEVENNIGYVSTPVSMYYHPVINLNSDYALVLDGKVRLEKNVQIEFLNKTTFNDKEFYYAKAIYKGEELYGFVPINFTTNALAQKVVTQSFIYKTLDAGENKPLKVFNGQDITEELFEVNQPLTVKLLKETELSYEIEIVNEDTVYIAYVQKNAFIDAPKTAIRNIILVVIISLVLFSSSIFFIKRKKF